MEIALTYIFGIGRSKSREILREAGIAYETKTDQITRGQRTHTNARTRKGPRRAIAGKKK